MQISWETACFELSHLSDPTAAEGFLKTYWQKKKLVLLSQCFPLLVIGYPFNYRDFLLFDKTCSKTSVIWGKGLNVGYNLILIKSIIDKERLPKDHRFLVRVPVQPCWMIWIVLGMRRISRSADIVDGIRPIVTTLKMCLFSVKVGLLETLFCIDFNSILVIQV